MNSFLILAFLAFCGWVNRWRGGGRPGHVWAAPYLVPALVLTIGTVAATDLTVGLIAGLGWAFWAMWGFGDTSMGRSINPRAPWPWPIEWLITNIKGWPKEAAGMFFRSLFAAPFFIGMALYEGDGLLVLWLLPFALLVAGAYVVAFRLFWPGRLGLVPTVLAEVLTGMGWGGAILLAAHG